MYKPSQSFTIQKLIGREFEQAMIPVLEEVGLRVIDVDHWSYNHKKGRDVIVEKDGYRNSIEFKLDKLSEKTGNKLDVAQSHLNNGEIYLSMGNYSNALNEYTQASRFIPF